MKRILTLALVLSSFGLRISTFAADWISLVSPPTTAPIQLHSSCPNLYLQVAVSVAPPTTLGWSKLTGPGSVTFSASDAAQTTAVFSAPGAYTLRVSGTHGSGSAALDFSVSISAGSAGAAPTSGLILHYPFDEGGGTTVADAATVGNNHITTGITGATWSAAGKFGGAYGTDTSTNVVPFFPANPSDLTLAPQGEAFTVSVWSRTTATATARSWFGKNDASNVQLRAFTNSLTALRGVTGGTQSANLTLASPINDDTWRLVTLVSFLDGATWKSRLYIDDGASSVGWTNGTATSTGAFRVGARTTDANGWAGLLDDFRVYNRALSQAEIAQIYNAVPGNIAPTVAIAAVASPQAGAPTNLDATVADDALPTPPAAVSTAWSLVSGPGTVSFGNAAAIDTTATFSTAGSYVLRLSADDGAVTTFAETTVVVNAPITGRPNIIFILADDFGIDGISAYGSEDMAGLTPNLDTLATSHMRFNRVYAQPICVPSRCAFLSGQYPRNNGAIDNDGSSIVATPARTPALPQILRGAGYRTAAIGKDHAIASLQTAWGFDEWLTGPSGHYYGVSKNANGTVTTESAGTFFPDTMQTWLLDFITRSKPAAGNGYQPFFAYYSLVNPHVANQGGAFNSLAPPVPWNAAETNDATRYRNQIQDMDAKLGALLAHLTAEGIAHNTLVLFVGDNGTLSTYKSRLLNPATGLYQTYQGAKNDTLEGGSLVPMMIHWPAAISTPVAVSHVIDFTDFLPTFAELAGATLPAGVNGHSFAGLLTGSATWTPRPWAHVQLANQWNVRTTTHRMDRDGSLWDMSNAPFTRTLIPTTNTTPSILALRAALTAALTQLDPQNGITYEYHQDNRWSNPARAWKIANFGSPARWFGTLSGDLADPDHDGVLNLFERAFGTSPNSGTNTLPVGILNSGYLQMTYPNPVTGSDTVITPEVGDDLATWSSAAADVTVTPGPTTSTATDQKSSSSEPKRFMRLKASRVTPWTQP